jgi:hypothetical protein
MMTCFGYDASALAVLPTMAWLPRFHLSAEKGYDASALISAAADFFLPDIGRRVCRLC